MSDDLFPEDEFEEIFQASEGGAPTSDALTRLMQATDPEQAVFEMLGSAADITGLAIEDRNDFEKLMLDLQRRGAMAKTVRRLEVSVAERRKQVQREEKAAAAAASSVAGDCDALEQAAAAIGEADQRIEDLADTLELACRFLRRFVWFTSEAQVIALALWIMHTYCIDAAVTTPRISVRAPTKGCGKSRLLEVLNMLVLSPEYQITPTAAVTFRLLGSGDAVTLLYDEIDVIYGPQANGNEELRGVIDAGQRRGGTVARCQGDEHKVVRFPVFGPIALSGIGRLPGTIEDRCIVIDLAKKGRDVTVERFRPGKKPLVREAEELRGLMAAWAKRHVEALTEDEPELPDALSDRQQDGWEPLLAIADAAGGSWPEQARKAALYLHDTEDEIDDSFAVRLLAAIRRVFHDLIVSDRIATHDLIDALHRMDDEPWGEWRRGAGLKPSDLSKALADFKVRPRQWKRDKEVKRGYLRADLEPVWARYLEVIDLTDSDDDVCATQKNGQVTDPSRYPVTPQVRAHFQPLPEDPSDTPESASDQGGNGVTDASCYPGDSGFAHTSDPTESEDGEEWSI